MREIPGSNSIGDIAFFSGKICSTVTYLRIFENYIIYTIKSVTLTILYKGGVRLIMGELPYT